MGIRFLIISLALIAPISYVQVSFAEPDHIGIQLSNTCKTMVINNIPGCPSYEEILTLHPDTSNKIISGDFEYSDDGFYERQKSIYIKNNHWQFYRYMDGTIIWIDPPGDMKDRIRMITIESSIPVYKIGGQNINDFTHATGHDRWTNSNCSQIAISAKNWVFLLGDTMNYILHNCDKSFTNFDPIKYDYLGKTIHDHTTTYKWQLDNWIAQSKERCKGICREY